VKKFGLSKTEKIYLKNDFKLILEQGKKVFKDGVILWFRPNPATGRQSGGELAAQKPKNRIGIIVSRRLGGAVRRNRCKRLLREAFRLNRHLLIDGVDCIFYPKSSQNLGDYYAASAVLLALAGKAKILKNDKGPQ
jgi:ribonuclease P protein component